MSHFMKQISPDFRVSHLDTKKGLKSYGSWTFIEKKVQPPLKFHVFFLTFWNSIKHGPETRFLRNHVLDGSLTKNAILPSVFWRKNEKSRNQREKRTFLSINVKKRGSGPPLWGVKNVIFSRFRDPVFR